MNEEEYLNLVEKYKQLEDKCNRAFRVYLNEANTAGLVTRKYKEHEAVESILDVNPMGVDYRWSETWQYGGHDQGENFIPMEFILDDKYEEAIRNSIWVDRKKEIEKKTKDEAERTQRKLDERRALFEQLKSEFGESET
jgi:DNA primase